MPRKWERIEHPLEIVYRQQRANAKKRSIRWVLSFKDWLKLWEGSGHLTERGRAGDQYCMSRFNDKGAYEIGNVHITTNKANHVERNLGNDFALGYKHSKETKAKVSRSKLGNKHALGYKHTKEAKWRISASLLGNKHALGHSHPHTERSKGLIRISQIGNKHSLGYRHTEEAKKKISESSRRYWGNAPEVVIVKKVRYRRSKPPS